MFHFSPREESMPKYEIVVSAENNHYLVWQAMLFHCSCLKYVGQAPIVMVHKGDEPLLPGFERIRETGGRVQTAPNYRDRHGVRYPPRNTAGSLRHVEANAEFLVLCDPDMLFLQPSPFDDLALTDRQITFDFVGYLEPDAEEYQPALDDVCRRAGVDPTRLRRPVVNGGVPHLIPTAWQKPLSDEWLSLIELFPTISRSAGQDEDMPCKDWLATMWAAVMAVHRLGLEPVMTRFCATNCNEAARLPPRDASGPKLLHYCYGGPGFDKRRFSDPEDSDHAVWLAASDDGTVSGEIRRQLREAREFFGLS